MPHSLVPAAELADRLDRLRGALTAHAPDWSMVILEHKINLYYLTGTMQDGALIITADSATYYVRRSFATAQAESAFPDIRPMKSFRILSTDFPHPPSVVYVETAHMTLQKRDMLQKYLPFQKTLSVDGILRALRAIKSDYELDCMRQSGRMHAEVLETIAPSLLREGISEAALCMDICSALIKRGAMGISRFNQPMAEDVLGIASFGQSGLHTGALDSPSGTCGTCIAMKSIGSSRRVLHRGETLLLDIPSGYCGYHTDKSISFFYGKLNEHPYGDRIARAHAECVRLEKLAATLMTAGAVPSAIYAAVCDAVDPQFADGFMNGCQFLGHSVGLTMDETPVLARGFDAPLQARMTIAVEPKIALPGIGLVGCENTYEILPQGAATTMTGRPDTVFEIN